MSLRAPGSGLRCSLSAIRADHECPLPFEFAPSSTDGPVAGSNDPANPSITAPATFVVTQTTNGVTVDAGTEAITSNRNLSVSFASETRGAVIFYTTDGSDPVPGQPATRRFDPDAPIEFAGHESGATVRTIALGPSMYPSIVTERLVSVFWDAAEAPVFTPAPGNYTTNQSVEITTPTANATIYYTIAEGTGAAPVPEPGAPGTFEYTGPIAVEGTGTAKSISAVSVRDEMVASPVSSAVYSIGFEPAQSPTFSLPAGSYASDQSVALATTEADATIYYTLSTTATAPPTPVPGAVGTFEYTGSISVAGNGSVRSITAIAVSPQKLNSLPVSATWSISYPQASAATFAPGAPSSSRLR
ncbi:MAG: chitobiase/beta-hexosaminidase C-terminal domain-containing protein [Spirochaetota bacterium]